MQKRTRISSVLFHLPPTVPIHWGVFCVLKGRFKDIFRGHQNKPLKLMLQTKSNKPISPSWKREVVSQSISGDMLSLSTYVCLKIVQWIGNTNTVIDWSAQLKELPHFCKKLASRKLSMLCQNMFTLPHIMKLC